MGNVYDHAEPIHFADYLFAEIGQAVVTFDAGFIDVAG